MPFEKELQTARIIATRSAQLAISYQTAALSADYKQDNSPVTVADKECERLITSMLAEAFPGDGLLGEEGSNRASQNGRKWIIDPIDGTRDFIRGMPLWAVLIGLEVDGVIEVGVAHMAARNETYYAIRGSGAYLNDTPIRRSNITSLDRAVVCFNGLNNVLKYPFGENVLDFLAQAWAVRSMGGCVDAMMVASGRAEVWVEPAAQPWDLAPVKVILEEAGARYMTLHGGSDIYSGGCIGVVPGLEKDIRHLLGLAATSM